MGGIGGKLDRLARLVGCDGRRRCRLQILDRGRDLARHADPRVALADLDLGQARTRQQLGQIFDIGSVDVDLGHCLFRVRFRTGAELVPAVAGGKRDQTGPPDGSARVAAFVRPWAVFVATGTRSCTSLEGYGEPTCPVIPSRPQGAGP